MKQTFALILFAVSTFAQAVEFRLPEPKDPYIAIGNISTMVSTMNETNATRCRQLTKLDDIYILSQTFPESFVISYVNKIGDIRARASVQFYVRDIYSANGDRALIAEAKNNMLAREKCSWIASYQ